jgi:hypothetical protein
MKISIYAPYAKERFWKQSQYSILHLERIGGKLLALRFPPVARHAGSGWLILTSQFSTPSPVEPRLDLVAY